MRFFPGQAELTNTPAFGGAVEQFSDFGVMGMIIYRLFIMQSIFMALLSYLTYHRPGFDFNKIILSTVLPIAIQPPAFALLFPGVLYVILIIEIALGLKVTR